MKSTRVLLSLTLLASTPCIIKTASAGTDVKMWQKGDRCLVPTQDALDQIKQTKKIYSQSARYAKCDCLEDLKYFSKEAKDNNIPLAQLLELKTIEGDMPLADVYYINAKSVEKAYNDTALLKHANHKIDGSYLWKKDGTKWVAEETDSQPEVTPSQELRDAKEALIKGFISIEKSDAQQINPNHVYIWEKTTKEGPTKDGEEKEVSYQPRRATRREAMRHKAPKPQSLAAIRNILHTNDTTITKLLDNPKTNKTRLEKAVGLHKELQQKLRSNLAVLRTLHDTATAKQEVSTKTQINQLTTKRNALIKELNLDPTVAYYVQATIDAFTNEFNVRPEKALQYAFGYELMTGNKRSKLLPMVAQAAQYVPDTSWGIFGTYEPQEVKDYNATIKQLKEISEKLHGEKITLDNEEKLALIEQQQKLTASKTELENTIHAKAVEYLSPLVQDKLWKDTKEFEGKMHDLLLVSREIEALENTQKTLADARKAVGAQIADHVATLAHKEMKKIVQEELEKVASESSEGENNRQERRKALWQNKALRQKAIAATFECSAYEASILASFESEEKKAKKDIPAAAKKNSRRRKPRRKAKTS
ncbi:MAG: hypothetical protein WD055_04915 [Candidatus Dependentiae bacterium]